MVTVKKKKFKNTQFCEFFFKTIKYFTNLYYSNFYGFQTSTYINQTENGTKIL